MSRANAVCDRCGFVVPHSRLRREWTGNMVCPRCWDPRPPDTRPPRVKPEGLPVRNARPEPEPVFRDPEDNGWDSL